MADDLRLLPAGIDDARSRALLKLIGRLDNLDLTALLVYRIDDLPEEALRLLAWQFNIMGDDGWDLASSPEERRALIRRALDLHRHRGTPWAIREAVRALGYANAEIVEGLPIALYDGDKTYSAVETYGGGTRWALFRVLLDLGETKGVDAAQITRLVALIERWKNARSHLVDIGFRAHVEDSLEPDEEIDTAVRHSAEDVLPWGRRYDGAIQHDHGTRHLHGGLLAYSGDDDHSGWGEAGERHDSQRTTLRVDVGVFAEDRVQVAPSYNGHYLHSAINYGADQPPLADLAMPIRVTRHIRHDGRYRHAGDLYDGARAHAGTRPFYTGVFHSGPVTTHLTAY